MTMKFETRRAAIEALDKANADWLRTDPDVPLPKAVFGWAKLDENDIIEEWQPQERDGQEPPKGFSWVVMNTEGDGWIEEVPPRQGEEEPDFLWSFA